MESYVDVLLKSLENKIGILKKLEEKNQEQSQILKVTPFDSKPFDKNTEEKGILIEELEKLDKGFDSIYARVSDTLKKGKKIYVNEITQMKKMISDIMDLSVSIQAHESRNKVMVEQAFSAERKQAKKSKMASKASLNYYMNMSKTNYVDPQFLDQHK
jgi:isopropylmalate/homocitrate/citramalate synthase